MLKKLQKVSYGSTNDHPLLPEEPESQRPAKKQKQNKVISKKKSVPKLALYYTVLSGRAVLEVLDTMGEWLAEFFGISPPLYWYLMEEYERQRAAEKEGVVRDETETACLTDNEEEILLDTGKTG